MERKMKNIFTSYIDFLLIFLQSRIEKKIDHLSKKEGKITT